ncbi:putative WRKY transcription factor 19 [Phytophthora ramorum]|uniref:putative WRKY transcription factor 19 n=1 Tax=Phytophthora ramorum TaxID=164328 RepID=UPI0030A5E103|nr:putative WRKY transcription factor 19 [Phytophthora ramorum]
METPPQELLGANAYTTADAHKFGLPFILNVGDTVVVASVDATTGAKKDEAELTKEEKKRRRTCKHDGCRNYIVHKGLCCRHGGGKKCSLEGCNTSAKHRGLCWKHGGSVACKQDGCDKKAKARGLCWAHGVQTRRVFQIPSTQHWRFSLAVSALALRLRCLGDGCSVGSGLETAMGDSSAWLSSRMKARENLGVQGVARSVAKLASTVSGGSARLQEVMAVGGSDGTHSVPVCGSV